MSLILLLFLFLSFVICEIDVEEYTLLEIIGEAEKNDTKDSTTNPTDNLLSILSITFGSLMFLAILLGLYLTCVFTEVLILIGCLVGLCCYFGNRGGKKNKLGENQMLLDRSLNSSYGVESKLFFGNNYISKSGNNQKIQEPTTFEGDPNGQGKILRKGRVTFEGEFRNGKREGKGREYYYHQSSGDDDDDIVRVKFEGVYSNNKRHGKGVEYSVLNNEKTISGVWKFGEISVIERDFVDLPRIKISDFKFDFSSDQIGSGGDGSVFRVEYQGEPAALKILRQVDANLRGAVGELAKFRQNHILARSQKIWSKVSKHPYILELMGWTGIDMEGPKGYVTELCKQSLSQAILDDYFEGKWNLRKKVMLEIAIGMQYLHSLSIMHRDLKCENILLDSSDTVKICDFEFSRYDDLDWKVIVSNVSVLGTPVYLAPEIIQGTLYTKSCDVFSYGILVFCLYFGVLNPYGDIDQCSGCGESLRGNSSMLIHLHVSRCDLRPKINAERVRRDRWIVQEIIEPCLFHGADHRPSFDEIVKIIKSHSQDERGREEDDDDVVIGVEE